MSTQRPHWVAVVAFLALPGFVPGQSPGAPAPKDDAITTALERIAIACGEAEGRERAQVYQLKDDLAHLQVRAASIAPEREKAAALCEAASDKEKKAKGSSDTLAGIGDYSEQHKSKSNFEALANDRAFAQTRSVSLDEELKATKAQIENKKAQIAEKELAIKEQSVRRDGMKKQLDEALRTWRDNPTQETRLSVLGKITRFASEYGIHSKCALITVDEKIHANPGALIRYQTVMERNADGMASATTANNVTNCFISLPIGEYFIWAERKGTPTSNPDRRFKLIEPEPPPITLVEDR